MTSCWLASLLTAGLAACTEAPPTIESTTVLDSTTDTVGPYAIQSIITGVTDEIVELRYTANDDPSFIPLPMLAADDGERFNASIPGRAAGTIIAYYVTVLSGGQRIASDPEAAAARPYTFTVLSP